MQKPARQKDRCTEHIYTFTRQQVHDAVKKHTACQRQAGSQHTSLLVLTTIFKARKVSTEALAGHSPVAHDLSAAFHIC